MGKRGTFEELAAECEEAFKIGELGRLRASLSALEAAFPTGTPQSVDAAANFAGLLVDIGMIVGDKSAVQRGQQIFKDKWDLFCPVYGNAQLYYNLGNSYKSLYDIERQKEGWRFNLESMEVLFEAKSNYWRALAAQNSTELPPEQLTNLANTLNSCGRIVDSLHYFDRALLQSPSFGMAHANRALALSYLNRVTGVWSVKLLYEVYKSSDLARKSTEVDFRARQESQRLAELAESDLRDLGYAPKEDPDSHSQTEDEYRSHDPYWRWCLDQSLSLSEHSLYCRCTGARRDDLTILTSSFGLVGDKVPLMELFLNRMKSEYCMARALFYQSANQENYLKWSVEPFEGTFTELYEGEDLGITAEFLRTSFRNCFGILDRIARGICVMLDLSNEEENVYFDRFWRPRDSSGEKRWAILNNVENPNLVALYGLARDLNERAGGEWSKLKRYRNLFEHEFSLIRNDSVRSKEPFWGRLESLTTLSRSEMISDALDMLRFTRAAIFYFAFFVRLESRSGVEGSNLGTIVFSNKDIGKE